MNKINLTTLLDGYSFELKKEIKKIYKHFNDLNNLLKDDIFLTKNEFNFYKKIALKKLNKQDITFDLKFKYFRNNKIYLKKGVFVPQYDTEQIIDIVKEKTNNEGRALEIGFGSGAISISLSKETNYIVDAIDKSRKAFNLAKKNDKDSKINFIKQDFKNFSSSIKYDLIISNPPYIAKNDKNIESWVKKNQPKNALYAKDNGIYFYKLIFSKLKNLLNENGYLILEIGFSQADNLKEIAKSISKNIEIIKDYQNLDRFIIIKYE